MQQVVFRFFGPPEISYKHQPIKIPRRRSRALLYYLVSTQAPQSRERLLALLCGDVDEESARNTFKTLLAEVRSLLRGLDSGIDWILSDGDLLRLNPHAPLWLDTEIFEKVATGSIRNLNQAIELYRGSFLDGFSLKDAPDFEGWMRSARDHFHRLYLKTLRRLAEMHESENQLEQAIHCTQLLIAADPLLEEAYARLMRLYWQTGDRIEAIRRYEYLCAALAKELAVKPSSSTQALFEQIARAETSTSPAPLVVQLTWEEASCLPLVPTEDSSSFTGSLPFLGRTAELSWLHQHLAGSCAQYSLLLFQGEMGIGKTRLLQEVRARFSNPWLILQGTCLEAEQLHPYHAIVEALHQGLEREDLSRLHLPGPWLVQLAQLLPEHFRFVALLPSPVAIEPLVLAEALVALLNRLARPQQPLLFVLDDLHWADSATLALLGHLAIHIRRGSVFLLGAYSQAMSGEPLEVLRRSTARQHILAEHTLLPLSAEDIQQCITSSLAGTPLATLAAADRASLLNWCQNYSEGNPFLAFAWLALTTREPGLPLHLSTRSIPESIETFVKQQLAHLSRDALSLLTAAAFVGTQFDPLAAAQLFHLSDTAAIAASEELLQRGIITENGSTNDGYYRFRHRIVKDVVFANTSTVQRYYLQRARQK